MVFAGGAQLTAIGLLAHGAGALEIVATTLLLNLRHVLYGLSLSERVPLRGRERLVAAHVLTDESFSVAMSAWAPSSAHFLGAVGERLRTVEPRHRRGAVGRTGCRPRAGRCRLRLPARLRGHAGGDRGDTARAGGGGAGRRCGARADVRCGHRPRGAGRGDRGHLGGDAARRAVAPRP